MCRAEAPGVEQFARANEDQLTVVGLGTQDDVDDADRFVDDYGTTFTMLWDSTDQSWLALDVVRQPAAVLYSADGEELGRWQGAFSEDEVLALLTG